MAENLLMQQLLNDDEVESPLQLEDLDEMDELREPWG